MADQRSSPKPDAGADVAPLKPTTAPSQAWVTVAMLVASVVLFAYIVMPSLPREKSPLIDAEAPDFALPVIHGGEPGNRIRLSELRGRVVVLDFWASWCTPCEQQARVLDELARQRSDRAMILGVATGDPAEAATRHAEQEDLAYPSVHDTHGDVALTYGATNLPTVVVIDREGTVVAVQRGIVDAPTLDELIKLAD
jgi:cytochrome c biogenesis protein CcmG/thiol:disulfide interchange protein DsbE